MSVYLSTGLDNGMDRFVSKDFGIRGGGACCTLEPMGTSTGAG